MKKTLFIFSVLLILNNCGGFEYVYQTNKNDFLINNAVNINVDGNDESQIYVLLRDAIGNNDEHPKYQLSAQSSKTESPGTIKKDATASKFNIQYSINYELYNLYKKCIVFNKEITTISHYNTRSEGYSFGTDLSQKESSVNNINKNINEFIFYINSLSSLDTCSK